MAWKPKSPLERHFQGLAAKRGEKPVEAIKAKEKRVRRKFKNTQKHLNAVWNKHFDQMMAQQYPPGAVWHVTPRTYTYTWSDPSGATDPAYKPNPFRQEYYKEEVSGDTDKKETAQDWADKWLEGENDGGSN